MENRERLGSRLGFIMLSAGCAIGCGNVWEIPVDVRAERWRKLHADLRDLPDRAGPAHHDHGIFRGARGADESPLYVSEIIRRQGKMEFVGHRLSHRKHCIDRFLCGGVRMDPLLFCKISDRAESGFRFEK